MWIRLTIHWVWGWSSPLRQISREQVILSIWQKPLYLIGPMAIGNLGNLSTAWAHNSAIRVSPSVLLHPGHLYTGNSEIDITTTSSRLGLLASCSLILVIASSQLCVWANSRRKRVLLNRLDSNICDVFRCWLSYSIWAAVLKTALQKLSPLSWQFTTSLLLVLPCLQKRPWKELNANVVNYACHIDSQCFEICIEIKSKIGISSLWHRWTFTKRT